MSSFLAGVKSLVQRLTGGAAKRGHDDAEARPASDSLRPEKRSKVEGGRGKGGKGRDGGRGKGKGAAGAGDGGKGEGRGKGSKGKGDGGKGKGAERVRVGDATMAGGLTKLRGRPAVMATCDTTKEKKGADEALQVLLEYAEKLYPSDAAAVDDTRSLAQTLAAEANEMKRDQARIMQQNIGTVRRWKGDFVSRSANDALIGRRAVL